jgi:two-component system response regulator EvgA
VFKALVVDDNPDFGRFLSSALEEGTSCYVVARAADGLDAVQKAEDIQPDLILLDIGLPKLNGFEVLRRVRKLSTHSKILIFSEDDSAELAQAALSFGANGYLLKSNADQLQDAVEAILQNKTFISYSR